MSKVPTAVIDPKTGAVIREHVFKSTSIPYHRISIVNTDIDHGEIEGYSFVYSANAYPSRAEGLIESGNESLIFGDVIVKVTDRITGEDVSRNVLDHGFATVKVAHKFIRSQPLKPKKITDMEWSSSRYNYTICRTGLPLC